MRFSPSKKDLLRNPSREHPQIRPGIRAREVVSSAHLQVRLFDEGRPDEPMVVAIDDMKPSFRGGSWETVIYRDFSKAPVEVETQNILPGPRQQRTGSRLVILPEQRPQELDRLDASKRNSCYSHRSGMLLDRPGIPRTETGHHRTVRG